MRNLKITLALILLGTLSGCGTTAQLSDNPLEAINPVQLLSKPSGSGGSGGSGGTTQQTGTSVAASGTVFDTAGQPITFTVSASVSGGKATGKLTLNYMVPAGAWTYTQKYFSGTLASGSADCFSAHLVTKPLKDGTYVVADLYDGSSATPAAEDTVSFTVYNSSGQVLYSSGTQSLPITQTSGGIPNGSVTVTCPTP